MSHMVWVFMPPGKSRTPRNLLIPALPPIIGRGAKNAQKWAPLPIIGGRVGGGGRPRCVLHLYRLAYLY